MKHVGRRAEAIVVDIQEGDDNQVSIQFPHSVRVEVIDERQNVNRRDHVVPVYVFGSFGIVPAFNLGLGFVDFARFEGFQRGCRKNQSLGKRFDGQLAITFHGSGSLLDCLFPVVRHRRNCVPSTIKSRFRLADPPRDSFSFRG